MCNVRELRATYKCPDHKCHCVAPHNKHKRKRGVPIRGQGICGKKQTFSHRIIKNKIFDIKIIFETYLKI